MAMNGTDVALLAARVGPGCKGLHYSDPADFAWLWGGGRDGDNVESWIAAGG